MNHRVVVRRARTALSILRHQGVKALARRFVEKLRGSDRPDEALMVFEVLQDHPRGVMVDVGAHHGNSLAPFADAGWRVYAFEPDPENRAPLVAHFGSYRNVVIDPRAVSDRAAQGVTLYRSDVSSGISGLSAFHASHVAAGTTEVTTLAVACAAWRVDTIDFLKIDTEGYDLMVLRGLAFDTVAPHVILCEFEDAKTVPLGYSFHDLARLLQQRGYRTIVSEWYPVQQYGVHHVWRRFAKYPCELANARAWGNLIATRSDDTYAALLALCDRWRER